MLFLNGMGKLTNLYFDISNNQKNSCLNKKEKNKFYGIRVCTSIDDPKKEFTPPT